jgi:hypothetical protein
LLHCDTFTEIRSDSFMSIFCAKLCAARAIVHRNSPLFVLSVLNSFGVHSDRIAALNLGAFYPWDGDAFER